MYQYAVNDKRQTPESINPPESQLIIDQQRNAQQYRSKVADECFYHLFIFFKKWVKILVYEVAL